MFPQLLTDFGWHIKPYTKHSDFKTQLVAVLWRRREDPQDKFDEIKLLDVKIVEYSLWIIKQSLWKAAEWEKHIGHSYHYGVITVDLTDLFEASVHDPNFLACEFCLPAEIL